MLPETGMGVTATHFGREGAELPCSREHAVQSTADQMAARVHTYCSHPCGHLNSHTYTVQTSTSEGFQPKPRASPVKVALPLPVVSGKRLLPS